MLVKLVVDKQPAPLAVVVQRDIYKRIRTIAPVKAAPDMIKRSALLSCDLPLRDILEHLAAGAGDLTQIGVPVPRLIRTLQLLRLLQERIPQPVFWYRTVITMVY